MENEILRDAVQIAYAKKKLISQLPSLAPDGTPLKAIAETLDVARSNLIERIGKERPVRATYRNSDDLSLLSLIRELIDTRPTYGYRRITALLNRRLHAAGEPRVNHKRSCRIMQLGRRSIYLKATVSTGPPFGPRTPDYENMRRLNPCTS